MHNLEDYPFEIRPLTPAEGGGYLISFTDFNECLSDGETVAETIENGMDALRGMIETLKTEGLPVPVPGSGGFSGKFVARVPKTLHAKLVTKARRDGVSLNALVTALLAEGVGSARGSAFTPQ
ncbi:MAG: type II toxin-antitoxin system HicB family antitoxin [Magnetococcales bacterium]|nr:type II toxin-antitoxin system HicB family antitoxin [Magnetococcales bacterium]